MKSKYIISFYVIVIFSGILILTSCGKKSDNKNANNSKDIWGGVTKNEYVKSSAALNFAYEVLEEYEKKDADSITLATKLSECIYDEQTALLEKTYPEGPVQKNYDYRIHLKDEDYEIILNNCIKQLGLNK